MSDADERTTRAAWIRLAVLLLVTTLAHSTALDGGFVFDDFRFIPENPAIRDFGNLPGFFTDAATMTASQGLPGWDDIYRPLRTLAFAVDWALFGPDPLGYRIVNLLWHLAAVALAWLLLRRILGDAPGATLGAGLFALHPVQTQAVSWISSRGDIMAAVFLLGAALLLLREKPGRAALVSGVVLYGLALLSKENAIALLALVPIHDRLFGEDRFRVKLYGALGIVTLVFLILRFQVASGQVPFRFSLWLDAGSALVVTIGSLLFPAGLPAFTGHIFRDRLGVTLGGVVLLAAALLAIHLWRRGRTWPRFAFAVLWFAACLAPVSGLLPLKSLAESRFSYLPALGAGLLLALLVRKLGRRAFPLGLATLVLLAAWTAKESRMWRSDLALWETAAARQERAFGEASPLTLLSLGLVHAEAGQHDAAIDALRRSVEAGENAPAMARLAFELLETGNPDEAVAMARRAVAFDGRSLPARDTLGHVLLTIGRAEEAVVQLEAALALAPDQAHLRRRLAQALFVAGQGALELNRARDALSFLDRAIRIDPRHPLVRGERGAALATVRGRLSRDEIADLDAACHQLARGGDLEAVSRIAGRPGLRRLRIPPLEDHLALSLVFSGRFDRAEKVLRELLTRRPDASHLHVALARAYRGLNRPADTKRAANEALRTARNDAERRQAQAFLEE